MNLTVRELEASLLRHATNLRGVVEAENMSPGDGVLFLYGARGECFRIEIHQEGDRKLPRAGDHPVWLTMPTGAVRKDHK